MDYGLDLDEGGGVDAGSLLMTLCEPVRAALNYTGDRG